MTLFTPSLSLHSPGRRSIVALTVAAASVVLPAGVSRAASLYAAGNNSLGQFGNGTTANSSTLVPVTGMNYGVTKFAAGFVSLSVKTGALYGWGYQVYGSTGTGIAGTPSSPPATTPQPSPLLTSGVTSVAAGQIFSMAIVNGALYTFGENSNGALGNGTALNTQNAMPMVAIGLGSGVTAVSGGQQHGLALQNGALYSWGYAVRGSLGNGTSGGAAPNVLTPTPVPGYSSGVTMVAGGSNHSLIVQNNIVYGFGDNRQGAVGNNGITDGADLRAQNGTPSAVVGLPAGTVTDIAAGGNMNGDWSMALVNGAVYAWGSNFYGQLGDGTSGNIQTQAIPVTGITGTIVDIEAGASSAYALDADGSLWSWGNNAEGRLAIGSVAAQFNTPQHLLAPTGYRFSAIAAGTVAAHVLVAQSALPVYFTGASGNSLNAVGNYAANLAGTTPAPIGTVESTDVFFGANTATAGGLAGATVTSAMNANSLTFGTGMSAANAVTVGGPGTITLYADKNTYAAGTGIVMQSGAAAVTINAPLAVAQSQSWNNNSANALTVNGSVALGTSRLTLGGAGNTVVGGAIGGSGGLTKSGNGTVSLTGTNTYTDTTVVTGGTLRVSPAAATPLLAGTAAVGGTDIRTGEVRFIGGNAAAIRALLSAGFANGFTSGTLRSSTATAVRGIGYADLGTEVNVKNTLYGDADLDGGVSINDFNALAGNFGKSSGQVWTSGDFDYDGGVSINDFNLLAGSFGQSLSASSEMWAGLVAFAAAHNDLGAFEAVTGVPEPTSLSVVAASMMLVLRRRRAPV